MSQLVFKCLFISICHQFNWDFLQAAMAKWLLPGPEHRLAEIATTRPSDLRRLLSDYPKPDRIRAPERARMLRTTAAELQSLLVAGHLEALLLKPRLEGPSGFYEVMRAVSAFAEDALEKKIRVLAHDLYRESILVFADPENLRPAVEYHLLRLYIRSGRVYPTDTSIRDELLGPTSGSRPRLVKLLREAVEEAMTLTAFYANIDVATLNYIEWQIGRAICTPEMPHCSNQPTETIPDEIAALSINGCPYAGFCQSLNNPAYGLYHEPQFQKAIY